MLTSRFQVLYLIHYTKFRKFFIIKQITFTTIKGAHMIYFVGDIHRNIDISKLNTENFPEQRTLTKNDYVIICGDFGCVWDDSKSDKYWLDWFNTRNYTTLFCDGNHENFDLLYEYPVEERFGGHVGVLRDSVFHLKRGEIYEIDNLRIFTFGGAASHDKAYRKEGVSWWPQELATKEKLDKGLDILESIDYDIDIVISHTCPESVMNKLFIGSKSITILEQYFEVIRNNLDERNIDYNWYFGHFHQDKTFDDKFHCLYEKIHTYNI